MLARSAAWLSKANHGLTVVFTTYQSGEALSKAARSARFRFDLGIMDEAHKTVGDGARLFSHLLHDRNLPIRRRIFMTATERRYAGQSDEVLSMDNPAIYGETFHLLSFKRALEYAPPILSDYKIISIAVSRDEVAELIRKNVFVRPDKGRWNKEIEAEMLASLIALRKAMAKHPIRHAVSFHSSIQRAELFKTHNDAFSHAFPKYGSLETFHVSGKTPTGTRARIIGEFAQTQRGLITNARCLTEGVDVPDIDCVLFADPRRSAVDIVQAVGRALRPAPGKKLGYVIVPILHDADATPDDIFESDSFQEILTTLRALAANDDRIIEYFRAVSQGRQRSGGGTVEFDWTSVSPSASTSRSSCGTLTSGAGIVWLSCRGARSRKPVLLPAAQTQELDGWLAFCKGECRSEGDYLLIFQHILIGLTLTMAGRLGRLVGDRDGRDFSQEIPSVPSSAGICPQARTQEPVEWYTFCRGKFRRLGRLPEDIPRAPEQVYGDKGWRSWGDWLGTGKVANQVRKYRSFREARAFARKLKLNGNNEWRLFCKGEMPKLGRLPADIPTGPDKVYANKGWGIGATGWGPDGRAVSQEISAISRGAGICPQA